MIFSLFPSLVSFCLPQQIAVYFSLFLKNETNNKKSCEINTLLSGTTAVGHFHRKVPGQSNCNIHIPYYFPTKSVKNPELKIFKKDLQILSSHIIILFSSFHIYFFIYRRVLLVTPFILFAFIYK